MWELCDVMLREVWNWELLGLKLGIADHYLKEIEHDFPRLEKRKFEMLRIWLQIDVHPSWSKLVKALVHINERHLAWTVAERYGNFLCIQMMLPH